jgi:hypothetical protein
MTYIEWEGERYYPVWVERRKEWRLRVHDVKTGRIVRWETMYRLTLAINYVVHHNYYSEVTQAWGPIEWLEEHQEEWENELIERVETAVDYPKENWWFPAEPSKELEPYKERLGIEPFTKEERSEYLGGK